MNRVSLALRFIGTNYLAIAVIVGGILGITYLHYSTTPGFIGLHAVYRYFYFLPIVYAALRFGYWGGLVAALAASVLFAPHIIFKWGNFPGDSINDLLVVVVFLCVATITGLTVDRLRASQEAQRLTADELSESLHKLEEQGAELRRAEWLSALGSLAGGLAHQIRNPVGIIRASVELLEEDAGPGARESVAVIEEEADRIEYLVQDLLRYADGTQPQFRSMDACDLLERVVTRLRPMVETQGIEIQSYCDRQLPNILIDPGQMEQALLNLTVNAIQAIQQNGVIVLAARASGGDSKYVDLFVSDNGPGIDETRLQRIFDPFFSTKDSGTGLGLNVVHRIVEDHNATIHVRSSLGMGATFVIRVECAPE